MKLSELISKLQGIIYSDRIMLAESDEQKECYSEEDKSSQKKLFDFPEINSEFKLALNSSWVNFTKEYKNEEEKTSLDSVIYVETFDFLTDTAKFVRDLKLSDMYLTNDANANKTFSPTQMLNFCNSAKNLLPRILMLNAFLTHTENLLGKNQDWSAQYAKFHSLEKEICEKISPLLKTATSLVEPDGKVNLEKFSSWYYSNSGITKKSPAATSNSDQNSTQRNEIR